MPPAHLTLEKVPAHTLKLLSVPASCLTQVFQSAPFALGLRKSATFIPCSPLSLPGVSLARSQSQVSSEVLFLVQVPQAGAQTPLPSREDLCGCEIPPPCGSPQVEGSGVGPDWTEALLPPSQCGFSSGSRAVGMCSAVSRPSSGLTLSCVAVALEPMRRGELRIFLFCLLSRAGSRAPECHCRLSVKCPSSWLVPCPRN